MYCVSITQLPHEEHNRCVKSTLSNSTQFEQYKAAASSGLNEFNNKVQ